MEASRPADRGRQRYMYQQWGRYWSDHRCLCTWISDHQQHIYHLALSLSFGGWKLLLDISISALKNSVRDVTGLENVQAAITQRLPSLSVSNCLSSPHCLCWLTSLGAGQTWAAAALPARWQWCRRPRYHTGGYSHPSSPPQPPLEPSCSERKS